MDEQEVSRQPDAAPAKPSWKQKVWTHLCVWAPFLANPHLRAKQAIYPARDYRVGGVWTISLPKQCWKSGKTDGLLPRVYEMSVRAFEMPLGILAGTIGLGFFSLLLAVAIPSWGGSFLIIALIAGLAGTALLFAKSWNESVEIRLWSRPEHMDSLQKPEVVIYEEMLTLVAPTDHLAEASRQEILAKRREVQKYVNPDAVAPPASESAPLSHEPPPPRTEYRREELPPIKFDE